MKIKKAVFAVVFALAAAALVVPLIGQRASAAGPASASGATRSRINAAAPARGGASTMQQEGQQREASGESQEIATQAGKISAATLKALGLDRRLPKGVSSLEAGRRLAEKHFGVSARAVQPGDSSHALNAPRATNSTQARSKKSGAVQVQSGQPRILNATSALSAALMTAIGGRDNQFSEVTLIADWDGREDCAADREAKVDDFSFVEPEIDMSLTRTAISEHTIANGFLDNQFYYGDSIGNFWVTFDLDGDGLVDVPNQVNIPELVNTGASDGFALLNPTANDCIDDQVAVTGIAVNPVADLGDFGLCGIVGEVTYVSVFDSEGCAANAANQPIRTRIFAFATFEIGGSVFSGGARQILRSQFSNIAGVAVDDDGSLYYQLVDLITFSGAAIFKATEICRTVAGCDNNVPPEGGGGKAQAPAVLGNPRINRVISLIPTSSSLSSTTVLSNSSVRSTNYGGGLSSLYGNIVSLATGSCNVLYAAVSRSFVSGDVSFEQLTEGLFPAPTQFGAAGTPSMIISFADCSGAFDVCSGEATGSVNINVGGTLPVADGFADVGQSGLTRTAGVNNFRLFVLGNGPDLRPAAGGTAVVPGTPSTLLKVDMQIDYSLYSGLVTNEQDTVFVISGGTPAGIGKNPSPMLGEVLCFEDGCPADRRADFVDLRGDTLPNPPASGGNVGDGDSDRFDHIFYQAPLDQLTLTPAGLAGLARGFLRYTNRLAVVPLSPGVTLGNTQDVQGDDDTTTAVVLFENLDPGHQVAGGDDQNTPFRGDDDDGAGTPPVPGPLSGGFEFVFGGPVGAPGCVWNGLFINSNGSVTFGDGDTSFVPSVPDFRVGLPKIAPAWTDLNPSARSANTCTFPVQALGFANINAFKVRWINVPQFGNEICTGAGLAGASNTFSVTLYDDGTGIDENANQPLNPANPIGNNAVPFDLQEGPTDLRYTREPNTGVIVGCSPRPEGSGFIIFDFCRMDLLGTAAQPVLTGYSIGGLNPLNPPGLCEINLSKAAAAADTNPFGVLTDTNGETANICANCCIGEGTEPTLFEFFNEGLTAGTGSGGEVTFARPDFDLRFEGNDSVLCSSARQRDLNRGRVCLYGVGCAPPPNPACLSVVPGTFVTNPTTTGIINALCAVQLNLVGCGFYPNEVTTICQGFQTETGIPLQRPGKTVTTAATLACDTNGDGIAEAVIVLTGVTPVNCNLVRATAAVLASAPGTAFPDTCCGGNGIITVTTAFSAGDNNVFGPFTRTSVCTLALGARAPVVYSITPSNGNCALPSQDLLISGACFCYSSVGGTTVQNVTSVIFQDKANPANTVTVGLNPSTSGQVKIVTCQLLDVEVNFTSANAGKTFLVYVTGPNGSSRNLAAAVAGAPAGCPLGNEQGFQVTFACNSSTTPPQGPTPDIAVVTGCHLDRQETGQFFLDVTGTGIKEGAIATVGGVTPKKIKVVEVSPGTTNPTKLRLVKKICNGLPGNVIITNPGPNGAASQPFNCTERCPAD